MRIIFYVTMLFFISCQTQGQEKFYFDGENENNNINTVCVNDDKMYVGGFHNQPTLDGKPTYTILCINNNFETVWEKNFGTDSNGERERISSFCLDEDKNIYLVGISQIPSGREFPILIKADSSGRVEWQKKLDNHLLSFSGIKYQNKSLVLSGILRDDKTLFNDTCVVYSMNVDGDIVWEKHVSKAIINVDLEVLDGKILVSYMASGLESDYPDTRISCMTMDGDLEWNSDLTESSTGIGKGVYTMGLVAYADKLYAVCRSQNAFLGQFKTFELNKEGKIEREIPFRQEEINDSDDEIFILSDYRVNRYPERMTQVVALCKDRKDNSLKMKMSQIEIGREYISSAKIGEQTYLVGNIRNHDNLVTYWFIRKK